MSEPYEEMAKWLVGGGYPIDYGIAPHPPVRLWSAIVDVIHEDVDGSWHNNELSRAEVDEWLRSETVDAIGMEASK